MFLQDQDIVLFQGDSVTDCGRNREDYHDLGVGYPMILSSPAGPAYHLFEPCGFRRYLQDDVGSLAGRLSRPSAYGRVYPDWHQ